MQDFENISTALLVLEGHFMSFRKLFTSLCLIERSMELRERIVFAGALLRQLHISELFTS